MPYTGPFDFLLLFGRKIESVPQKNIRIPLVPRVTSHNRIKRFGKSNFLHGMKKARLKRAPNHNRQTWNRQLLQDLESFERKIIKESKDPLPLKPGTASAAFFDQFSK